MAGSLTSFFVINIVFIGFVWAFYNGWTTNACHLQSLPNKRDIKTKTNIFFLLFYENQAACSTTNKKNIETKNDTKNIKKTHTYTHT